MQRTPTNDNFKDSLPAPLAEVWHAHTSASSRVRPDYLRALSHLIDFAELYTQYSATIVLSALARTPRSMPAGFDTDLDTFLRGALNLGHWLSMWKCAAAAMLRVPVDADRPFEHIARFIVSDDGRQGAAISEVDALPTLRNRRRGHTFTIPEPEARSLVEVWRPKIETIVVASTWLWKDLDLVAVRDRSDDLVELASLQGNVLLAQADTRVVRTKVALVRDALMVCPRLALEAEALAPESALHLEPLLMLHNESVFFFQRAAGKKAHFMSASAVEHEAALGPVRHAFASLLPRSAGAPRPPPTAPAWSTRLRAHDLLCEAAYAGSSSQPAGFFRGNIPSWADLRDDLDVRRSLVLRDEPVSPENFANIHIPQVLAQALRFEAPTVLFSGPGGSGKSTQLLRCAFDLHRRHGDEVVVLRQWLGTDFDPTDVSLAAKENPGRVVAVFLDEAARAASSLRSHRMNLQHRQVPVAFFCAERPNLWPDLPALRFDIEHLDAREIDALLDGLERSNALGALASLSREERRECLRVRYDQQLLVTLREVTEGAHFDEIIESEYRLIQTPTARQVYLSSALMHRAGAMLPEAPAVIVAGLTSGQRMKAEVRRPCEGALVREGRAAAGYYYRTRHRVIAEVLCQRVLARPDDAAEEIALLVGALVAVRDDRGESYRLAVDLLVAPENALTLEVADLMPFARNIRATGSRFGRFLSKIVARSKASKGVMRLVATVLSAGIHKDADIDVQQVSGCVGAMTRVLSPEASAAALVAGVKASTWFGHATDVMVTHAAHILQISSGVDAAVRFCDDAIARYAQSDHLPMTIYLQIASLQRRRGDLNAARRTLETAIARTEERRRHFVGQHHIFVVLASVLREQGAYDDAVAVLTQGLSIAERNDGLGSGDLYAALSTLEHRRGNLDAAMEWIERGVEGLSASQPQWLHLVKQLTAYTVARKDPHQALLIARGAADRAVALGADRYEGALLFLVATLVGFGDRAGAVGAVEAARAHHPELLGDRFEQRLAPVLASVSSASGPFDIEDLDGLAFEPSTPHPTGD